MILNCEVVRKDFSNENVELPNAYFLTKPIENLEAKDESEEFDNFLETIQEKN